MSAKRPKKRRELPAVSAKTLAGHIAEASGISSSRESVGRMTLNPEIKYSWMY